MLLLVLVAAFPQPGEARFRVTLGATAPSVLAADVAVARAYWSGQGHRRLRPCLRRGTLRVLVRELDAWGIWGWGGLCFVWIDPEVLGQEPWVRCQMVVHEVGHALYGLSHPDDPMSVMYTERPHTPWGTGLFRPNAVPACAPSIGTGG